MVTKTINLIVPRDWHELDDNISLLIKMIQKFWCE